MGFYEGVNLSLAYCDDCGHEELEMDVRPPAAAKPDEDRQNERIFKLFKGQRRYKTKRIQNGRDRRESKHVMNAEEKQAPPKRRHLFFLRHQRANCLR